jgi:hypothetical protein
MSTSTSTARASIPNSVQVENLESMATMTPKENKHANRSAESTSIKIFSSPLAMFSVTFTRGI